MDRPAKDFHKSTLVEYVRAQQGGPNRKDPSKDAMCQNSEA